MMIIHIRIDLKNMRKFKKNLQDMKGSFSDFLGQTVVAEGTKFVQKAVKTTRNEHIFASGNYKRSFHSDPHASISNDKITVGMGNYSNYALYIEKGFRSHFVPGYWQGKVFVYDPTAKKGMIVGSYRIKETRCKNGRIFKRAVPYGTVPGKKVVERSLKVVKLTQKERYERKIRRYIKDYMQRGF